MTAMLPPPITTASTLLLLYCVVVAVVVVVVVVFVVVVVAAVVRHRRRRSSSSCCCCRHHPVRHTTVPLPDLLHARDELGPRGPGSCSPNGAVIESRWVSNPLALAGKLRPRRLIN
jgi:hypothetical protein